ncbi:PLP-dependent aminotransferase family protein [Uliginosibacterium paludis]|uniref:PLP-dependent aminotransferase family protein n=1 Tax=Uliginosibacterium paludis TaxID=1615952 RepID=A0ABV2CSJ0_9RHOO
MVPEETAMSGDAQELMWRQLLLPLERGSTPLQLQLRSRLVNAMLDGRLAAGLRLPSGRELAAWAGLSRNTVVLVYDRLVEEGHLESRQREGYFVRGSFGREAPRALASTAAPAAPDWSRHLGPAAPFRWLDRPAGWQTLPYPFVFGQFDASLFPLAEWRECSRQALQAQALPDWAHDIPGNDCPELIEQLIHRVLPRRGIAATPGQILLTLGTQHGLYLLGELFGRPGCRLGVENPGYMDVRNIFGRFGGDILPLPVDSEGLQIGPALAGCRYLYCTPSHQCPTGVTLSTERRLALLAHAAEHDQIVFEDDYDPETQYQGQPLPALKAIDRADRVIYLGSFSKLLSPGLRLGYVVAPTEVIERLRVLRRLMVRQAPGNNPLAAAFFIREGHYDRLLQNTRNALAERAGLLVAALRRHLPEARFTPPQGGSGLWLALPGTADPGALREAAFRRGVLYDPGEPFFQQPAASTCLRLGFSSIRPAAIDAGIRELAAALASLG